MYIQLVVLVFLVIFTSGLNAQDSTELYDLPIEELLQVKITTASKYSENIADTPANVIVITKQQIQQRGYVNLLDLLQDLPSIDIQKQNDETRYHTVTLRGNVSNNKFLILQDGMRIDSPTRESIPIADNFPLYHAKQVEVLYGPASALYGADAVTGVINIITENDKAIDGLTVSTAVGSYNYYRSYLQMNKRFNQDLAFTGGAHIHESDTANLPTYFPLAYPKKDIKTFAGDTLVTAANREGYFASERSYSAFAKLTVSTFTFGLNRSFFSNATSTGVRPETVLYDPQAFWNTRIDTAYAKWHMTANDQLSGETSVNYASYEVMPNSKFKNIFVDFQDAYKYAKGKKFSIEQQLTYRFSAAHRLVGGIVWESFYSLPKSPDLAHPFNKDKPLSEQSLFYGGTDNTLPVRFFDSNYHNIGVYAQLNSELNQELSAIVGLRYDKSSSYGNSLNPRLGLVYKPYTTTLVKLLYGESFRAPYPAESFSHYGSFSGKKNDQGEYTSFFFHATNPNLKPEKSRTLEFSLSQQLRKNLQGNISGYYTRVENIIISRKDAVPIQFIPGGDMLSTESNINSSNGLYYGADVNLQYEEDFKGLKVQVWGNYSFVQGEVKEQQGSAIDVPYIARHKVKLGSTITWQSKYFITPRIYLIDRSTTTKFAANDKNNPLKSPGYVLVNLRLGAENVVKNLSAYVDIYNVLDTRYYNVGGLSSAAFTATPQQPRTLIFSLQYRF